MAQKVVETSLVVIERAAQMLAEADTIQKVKEFKDLTLTAADWARRKRMGAETIQHCMSYAVSAERKLGEMLAGTERAVGSDRGGRTQIDGSRALPSNTPPTLAELGITKRESSEAQIVAALPDDLFEKARKGELKRRAALHEYRALCREAERKKLAKRGRAVKWAGQWTLDQVFVADVQAKGFIKSLPESAADLIATDPPWEEKALDSYAAAIKIARKVLKPGAFLALYCGKMFLPEILSMAVKNLEYVWAFCVYQPDNNSKIQKHHIFEAWRPIVLFRKAGKSREMAWIADAMRCTRDKKHHEWGQGIEPAIKLIEAYTVEGEIVLDPFGGGGAVPYAAKQTHRRYLAFDKEKTAVKIMVQRLRDE